MTPGNRYLLFLHWFARVGAIVVICLATAVICGWVLDITVLKSVLPALAAMKVNTACAFLAAGVALWLLQTSEAGSRSFHLARVIAAGVALVGGLTLAEDIFSLELGIDQLLIRDIGQATDAGSPGRMAPATSFNFLLVGFALLALRARRSGLAASAQWLVAVPLFVATLAILGHAYGVSALYEVRPYTSMAVHTALTFFVLTLSEIGRAHV
jgi:hypothetical protein